jgi:hypothetical protein
MQRKGRIVARKMARELTAHELECVSGGGNTRWYDSLGESHLDTNYV